MGDARYFSSSKRGEIHELKEELNSPNKEKKKEAIKKVIAAMTVGKDVSALFPDVVNCMQAQTIEVKKLVYLYVINYAKSQHELAILAVNTFRKDTMDPNPLIRALAVRTMGSIKLEQMTEYLLEPLRRCCKDQDPYVRKTAAICIAKFFEISPDMVEDQGFVAVLKDMLSDANPMVVSNAVIALSEMQQQSGKRMMPLDEKTVSNLLLALNECTEWAQVIILDAITMYQPKDSRQAKEMIERVSARLSHVNSAVVLSAIKVIMKMMDKLNNTDMIRVMCRRLSAPLVTLLSQEPEIQYIALRDIRLIVQKRPIVLQGEVKVFFCKYNDPIYVKMEKLDVMVMLANERNVDVVVAELVDYANEVDLEFACKAVSSIGRIALKLEAAADVCVNAILELIEHRADYVLQESVVSMRDVFRKYPGKYEFVIGPLCENLESLAKPEAKEAIIWILGEYPDRIENAGDLLYSFLDGFFSETYAVQQELLTAAIKFFLKEPTKTNQDIVSKVLKACTNSSSNPDLRDRGYMYWRMLSMGDLEKCKKIVVAPLPRISDTSLLVESGLLETLLGTIGQLSSIYFIAPDELIEGTKQYEEMEDYYADASSVEDRNQNIKAVKAAMASPRNYDERTTDLDSGSEESSSSSEDEDDDDESSDSDEETPTAAVSAAAAAVTPDLPIQRFMVHPEDQRGGNGHTGLKVAAGVGFVKGVLCMELLIGNSGSTPLTGFAIQCNKNAFGLAPKSTQIAGMPDVLEPGSNVSVRVALEPNKLNSGTPPPNHPPLLLQTAIKTNVDIFYMNVPFTLYVVCEPKQLINAEQFLSLWQRCGADRQTSRMATPSQPLNPEMVIARLRQGNLFHVNTRLSKDGASAALYFGACLTNRLVVLLELVITRTLPQKVMVNVRTETPPLVNHMHYLIESLLQLKPAPKQ
ncbi:beta adaptin protein, putative [Perkinsus marinus ATCC 50983]|uniref:Beta adaptin protein, putative n=1 Tax=Perkinsus marinus (strain ATCC 50983 / TXsc) TaxID=423536 RepID=C5LX92_PERM5|nr:beta adaptin protein, putative [Perkinsus marinus ATCC 50983]EEQ98643.1 beta adaptin protein, putative [Perkinsus marinus ATCC 50983]|eukprot:XP_002765926.1 beta adaptin protein, putative [Perkinsus marinus ATCC 50983]